MLNRLHYAHTGSVSTLSRARESLYWPGMSSEVRQFVERCDVRKSFDQKQSRETFIAHEIPNRPWAKVGTDLFSYNGRDYLICVGYYSSFWEVDLLESTRSSTIIRKLKAHFARYGIPETCMSDNGPQYTSEEFKQFSRYWKFQHITSSPTYPQSNGKTEAAVKSAKTLMKKAKKARTDPYMALLEYGNTPTQGLDSSPVMRLMSRRTQTRLPSMPVLLEPVVKKDTYKKLMKNKEKQEILYNQRARDLKDLSIGDIVRFVPPKTQENQAVITRVSSQVGRRSFEVVTENGSTFRRNRRHLRKTKEDFEDVEPPISVPEICGNSTGERIITMPTRTNGRRPSPVPEFPGSKLSPTEKTTFLIPKRYLQRERPPLIPQRHL